MSEKLSVDIVFCDSLKEACFGIFEGLHNDYIKKEHSDIMKIYDCMDEETFDYRIPEGESKKEVYDRIFTQLKSLVDTKHSKIAISTHGRITRLFLARHGVKLDKMGNACCYNVCYSDGLWTVEEIG